MILGSSFFFACAHQPAPSSYAASQPHAYSPYRETAVTGAGNDEDQLTRLQLAMLDPPNTMSLVDRAVESHRRALEEEQRLRDASLYAGGKFKRGKTGGKGLAPSPWAKSMDPAQSHLAGLGMDCGQGYGGGNFAQGGMKSVVMQKSCLPGGDPRRLPSPSKSRIRFSGIPGNLWDTARSALVLHVIENDRLNVFLQYLRQKPGTVDFLMGRAEPYLPYLLGELRSQGLPADLILVPMVESAYQTTAVSPKQAAGLWQFVASTGQQYGLRLSETYDGRYDTHLATQAALRYLAYLNSLFDGDWTLALAAYNAGEGTVSRALQANLAAGGKGSFWELSLPEETRNYVLKIVALSRIIADPPGNGFTMRNAQSQGALTRVELRPDLRVQDLIARTAMAPQEFFRLNPQVRPDVPAPPEARNFMLPSDKAQLLMARSATKIRKIRVNAGETAADVAKRIGVPLKQLLEWNGLKGKGKEKMKPGQELRVQDV
jgi:membrane-bound lytic murein transglycosylase D